MSSDKLRAKFSKGLLTYLLVNDLLHEPHPIRLPATALISTASPSAWPVLVANHAWEIEQFISHPPVAPQPGKITQASDAALFTWTW